MPYLTRIAWVLLLITPLLMGANVSGDVGVVYAIRARLRRELLDGHDSARAADALEETVAMARGLAAPEDRMLFYQLLAEHATATDIDAAQAWIDEARPLATSSPTCKALLDVEQGAVWVRSGRHREAVSLLEEARPFVSEVKDSELAARIWTMLATAYDALDDVERMNETYSHALRLLEGVDDQGGLASVYLQHADAFLRRAQLDRSLDYLYRAKEILRSEEQIDELAKTSCTIAVLLARQGKAENALRHLDEGMRAAEGSNTPAVLAHCLVAGASVHMELNNSTGAETALLQALEYSSRMMLTNIEGPIAGKLGSLYRKQERFDEALPLLQRAVDLGATHPYPADEASWSYELGVLYRSMGMAQRSVPCLQRALVLYRELQVQAEIQAVFIELARTQAELDAQAEALASLAAQSKSFLQQQVSEGEHARRRAANENDQSTLRTQLEAAAQSVADLTEQVAKLQADNTELRDLVAEKDEFMAVAAHDLRNPLGDLRSMLQTVIGHFTALSSDDVISICGDLLTTTTRMQATVHAFLEISRDVGCSKDLQNETMDLVRLAFRAVERHMSRAESKDTTLRVLHEESAWATGDASILEAILDNLVSNAIKFSPTGTMITLDVTGGQSPSICVIDEGPGIPAAERAKLFTKYSRLSTRPTGGEESLGLGLYLAQRMASRINAVLSYEQTSSTGACFKVSLQPVG